MRNEYRRNGGVRLWATEEKIGMFEKNPASQQTARHVHEELSGLRRSIFTLQKNPEAPVAIGGSFLNMDTVPVQPPGIQYSGSERYVKTIVIRR
jgi:hypothetical protein